MVRGGRESPRAEIDEKTLWASASKDETDSRSGEGGLDEVVGAAGGEVCVQGSQGAS